MIVDQIKNPFMEADQERVERNQLKHRVSQLENDVKLLLQVVDILITETRSRLKEKFKVD